MSMSLMPTTGFCIYPATPAQCPAARAIANQFHLEFVDTMPQHAPQHTGFCLCMTPARLELHDLSQATKPLFVDFLTGHLAYRRLHGGGRKQDLAKAIGLKKALNPTVLDATAGLGRDGFVLAALGCQVHWLERAPIAAALLYDGWQRAQQDAVIGAWVQQRLAFSFEDARFYLTQLSTTSAPDVIYLDPMYPHRHKSALVKKEMRIFRQLVGADTDAGELLPLALSRARQRVVVKRPQYAEPLGEQPPDLSISGKNTRFDVYFSK